MDYFREHLEWLKKQSRDSRKPPSVAEELRGGFADAGSNQEIVERGFYALRSAAAERIRSNQEIVERGGGLRLPLGAARRVKQSRDSRKRRQLEATRTAAEAARSNQEIVERRLASSPQPAPT